MARVNFALRRLRVVIGPAFLHIAQRLLEPHAGDRFDSRQSLGLDAVIELRDKGVE